MEPKQIKKYPYTQSLVAVEAFVANFSAKITNIKEGLPVFTLNTGDETYYFEKRFTPKKDSKFENRDINNIVPRFVIDLGESPTFQTDQNTNQYIDYKYTFDNVFYKAQARRLAYEMPLTCVLVTSNFVKALEYFDMLASIVSTDKVLTYEYLGNTFESNYRISSFGFEKNSIEAGSSTRNFIIRVTVEYIIQLFGVDHQTIQIIDDGTDRDDTSDETNFQITAVDPDGTKTTKNIKKDCENC